MSRLTRDGTAEPVSRDQILWHARGQGNIHFPCSADHEQDWQPYPVDPYSVIYDDHAYIHTPIEDMFMCRNTRTSPVHSTEAGFRGGGFWAEGGVDSPSEAECDLGLSQITGH